MIAPENVATSTSTFTSTSPGNGAQGVAVEKYGSESIGFKEGSIDDGGFGDLDEYRFR
ncbi:Iron transport multicopper oxidase [Venturia inaequalis]|nr:Iron transport multicopper oxidase [Venturia inaequalis]